MKKLWIIARKDVKEAFHSRSTYIYIVIMLFLTFSYYSSYNAMADSLSSQNAAAEEIYNASRVFLTGLASVLPMMYSILVCTIFAQYAVALDKARRNIESLMVTPASLRQIWMGKTLAVTLPSIAIGISVAIVGYVALNVAAVMPRVSSFIIPDAFSILTALVIVPLLVFAIVSVVIYIQLVISNPRIASLVFTGLFLLLFFGAMAFANTGIDISFGYIYLGIMALCALISIILSRSLTRERVILSSKG